jgi:type IV pilus assembly protein PilV
MPAPQYRPAKAHACAWRAPQRGATLLEVLIAILVMSFGLAGSAMLMAAAMQYNKMSQFQIVALQFARHAAESIRANSDGFMADAYNKSGTYSSAVAALAIPSCAIASACTAVETASIDKTQLANNLRTALPGGDYMVQRKGTKADIWIMWMEPGLDPSMSLSTMNCLASAISAISASTNKPRCLFLEIAL